MHQLYIAFTSVEVWSNHIGFSLLNTLQLRNLQQGTKKSDPPPVQMQHSVEAACTMVWSQEQK